MLADEMVPGMVSGDKSSKIGFGDWFGGTFGLKQNDELLASGKWDTHNPRHALQFSYHLCL